LRPLTKIGNPATRIRSCISVVHGLAHVTNKSHQQSRVPSAMMTVILLAFALSMDAFAASLSQGAAARPSVTLIGALRIGAAFGSAQAFMPFLGWALGLVFASLIRNIDHWIAFALLTAIGGRMVYASLAASADDNGCMPLITGWTLVSVAIATSIDAAGVTIAFLEQPVVLTCAIIGIVTFLLSSAGVLLGGALGLIVGRRAELVGGLVLIGLGCKILVEHQFLGGG
jgi:putative Mn2+ efflux pump MntP